jgi:hypothetical protein
MIDFEEEEYWKENNITGNVYDNLVSYLKSKGKTFDDVNYIIVKRRPTSSEAEECDCDDCDDCSYSRDVEIEIEDFIDIAKNVTINNTAEGIKIVGDGWFITSSTDSFFEMVEIPSQPLEKLNLAKELLIAEADDDINIQMLAGIAYDEDDD